VIASKIRSIKREIRILGVDDGFFIPHTKGNCIVVGVVFRGGYWFDGIMRTQIQIDGMDATEKIGEMITNSAHYGQLRIVMLDGVTFAGFNIVDTSRLNELVKLPIIAITRKNPNFEDIQKALRNLTFYEERWEAISKANKIVKIPTRNRDKHIYIQVTGIEVEKAKKIIAETSTRSNIPEALRVAHLIASGMTTPL
jgi:endonuclease V-like protein UPF0215 family